MEIKKHKKTLFAFTIGLFIGIFVQKILIGKTSGVIAQTENNLKNCQTDRSTSEVKPPPQIIKLEDGTYPAPLYTEDMPDIFETKHPGEFKVTWQDVPGVTLYRIRVIDNKGNSVRSYTTSKHVAYVQRIPWDGSDHPFAMYKVYITSLNEKNEEGPKSELRKVKLYKDHAFFGTAEKVNPLQAPEIKSITTED
jgi:hypothetical protein